MTSSPHPSVKCPKCGSLRTVNEQRQMRPHGPKRKPCLGSGRTAEETRKLMQDQHIAEMVRNAEVSQRAAKAAKESDEWAEELKRAWAGEP